MPRHPIHTLLAEAAYAGREATEEELAELQLEPADTAALGRLEARAQRCGVEVASPARPARARESRTAHE
jgi:hypothetical protein